VRPPHLDSLVLQALEPLPESAARGFGYEGPSPFVLGRTRVGRPSAARAVQARPTLTINGILFRSSKPQAVVQDADGRSHICSVGDTVLEQITVAKIQRDRVVFRDASGTWDVPVQE
jgi:type II secretory pathway component PulC